MPATLAIAHALPGRVRFRLPSHARTEGLTEAVSAFSGVTDCTWTARTRSLLVRYEPSSTTPTEIAERVAARIGASVPHAETNGHSEAPAGPVIPAMFKELNGRVARATNGTMDLGSAIPLALVAWAALELLRGRTAPLAWSSALWYAHGLFRDYNLPSSEG